MAFEANRPAIPIVCGRRRRRVTIDHGVPVGVVRASTNKLPLPLAGHLRNSALVKPGAQHAVEGNHCTNYCKRSILLYDRNCVGKGRPVRIDTRSSKKSYDVKMSPVMCIACPRLLSQSRDQKMMSQSSLLPAEQKVEWRQTLSHLLASCLMSPIYRELE